MNFKKILLYNAVCIIVLVCIIEFCSFILLCRKYGDDILNHNKIKNPDIKVNLPLIGYKKVILPTEKNLLSNLRPVEYRSKSKKPVILFGCSYTYGFGLNDNETFSRKLADYTDRTVINRSREGTGLPFLYYQLSNKNIINDLPKDAEYIIYTLIPDHFPRLFRYRNFVAAGEHTLRFKIQDGKLTEDKAVMLPLHSLFTGIIIEEYLAEKRGSDYNKTYGLADKIISESHKIIKNVFPNAKFVIMYLENPLDDKNACIDTIEQLKKDNPEIIFINVNKEIPTVKERKYWLEDNDHPSQYAWDLIVPKITEILKLN